MSRFSERYGYVEVEDALQIEDMDDALRTGLWNAFYLDFFAGAATSAATSSYARMLWATHVKQPINESPLRWDEFFQQQFDGSEWYEVYDLVEAMIDVIGEGTLRISYAATTNLVLERERAGYRLLDGLVVPIVDRAEVTAVEDAFTATSGLPGARHHLQAALALLATRTDPDYANSIKESISAVESICSSIVGKRTTLGEALKRLDGAGVDIHPAPKAAWLSMYGYTSDDSGIRHGGQSIPTAELEDATYFLIVCSAFANLLIAKCARAGITLSPLAE